MTVLPGPGSWAGSRATRHLPVQAWAGHPPEIAFMHFFDVQQSPLRTVRPTRTPFTFWLVASVAACVTIGVPRPAAAQPVPVVNAPTPPLAVLRGQSAEVTLGGQGLAGVNAVGLADPRGLEVVLIKAEPANDGQVKLKLTAAADAEPGEREVRLIAPTGVSNPLQVIVDQYPATADAEPNDAKQPQPVRLPSVLTGTINGGG